MGAVGAQSSSYPSSRGVKGITLGEKRVLGGLQGDRQCTTHRYTTTSSDKVPQGKAKQDEATQKEPPGAGGGRQEIYLIEGVLIK